MQTPLRPAGSSLRSTERGQKSGFYLTKLVIWSVVVPAVDVLGGLAVLPVHLYCPAVIGLISNGRCSSPEARPGGWNAPTPHVPAPTDAQIEIAFSGHLALEVSLAVKPLELEIPDNVGAGGGRAQDPQFQGRRAGIRRDDKSMSFRRRGALIKTCSGSKRKMEPSGALRCTAVHYGLGLLWGKSARIVRGETDSASPTPTPLQAKPLFRQGRW